MKQQNENRKRSRSMRAAIALGTLAMAFGIAGFPGACPAAEAPGPQHPGGLLEVLASATVLSEAAMANQTAAGVQPSPLLGDQSGLARVLLWDELKPPELPPGANGSVTVNTASSGK